MLTGKDYCDYDTCVALREIGCRIKTEWYIHQPSYERSACYLCFGIPQETSVLDECDYIPRLSLYEAQKWLREEKNIIVDVRYGAPYYNVVLNHRITDGYHIVKDKNNRIADFIEYEKALSDGVKCAVKLLKENETIHR